MRKVREYLSLILGLISFASAIVIPVAKYYASPVPFTGQFQIEPVVLPPAFLVDPQHRDRANPPAVDATGGTAMDLLSLRVENNGPTARHDVAIHVSFVTQFRAVGVASTPPSVIAGLKWRDPIFEPDQHAIDLPVVPELPVSGSIQISIWGSFNAVFRDVQIRSGEGVAAVREGEVMYGPGLLLASNLWWISVVVLIALCLFFLYKFETRKNL